MVTYVPYLKYLGEEARNPFRVEEVALQIKANGYYQRVKEWRIFTEMTSRVEPAKPDGGAPFRVTVSCDHTFACVCPNLDRAVQFMIVYEKILEDLFASIGWPSHELEGSSKNG